MKKITLSACLALFLMSSCQDQSKDNAETATEQNQAPATVAVQQQDSEYAMKAASGGMMEVELGNMAMANASSQGVKDFGQGMVKDHSMANEELKALAASKQITLPATPIKEHQEKIDQLKSKTGAEFDKAYMEMMVADHKEDIELFQNEAQLGTDAELKQFASGKLPVLQHHLHMAEELNAAVNK